MDKIISKNHFKTLIIYVLRIFKNYFKTIFYKNFQNIYLPNIFIKNIIMINPNKIKYINSIPMKFYKSTQFIMDFDWDKNNKNIEKFQKNNHEFITCGEIIKQSPIKKCKSYFYIKKKISKFKEYNNLKNENDIISFLSNKVELYKSIKRNGLEKKFNTNIQFLIDRNFNLVKINSGAHRFAISRILKLKKIPIEVKLIHIKCFKKYSKSEINYKAINEIIKDVTKKYA